MARFDYKVKITTTLDQKILAAASKNLFYYNQEWLSFLRAFFGYKFYLLRVEKAGKVKGILILADVNGFFTGRRLVSLPFSYCGGIFSKSHKAKELLGREAIKLAKKLSATIELRGGSSPENDFLATTNFSTFIIDLRGSKKSIERKIRKEYYRIVAKARTKGIKVVAGEEENLAGFYSLYLLTRKKLGLPPQTFKFFLEMGRALGADFELLLVKSGKKFIAAGIFLKLANRVVYAYDAWERRYKNDFPNHLMIFEAIMRYKKQGFKFFDFGHSDISDSGIGFFKKSWSSDDIALTYFYWPHPLNIERTSGFTLRMAKLFFRIMPVSFSKILGGLIYRYLG